jgi:hypothetical protein
MVYIEFCKHALINELYKGKKLNGKKFLGIDGLLQLTSYGFKKKTM